MHALFRVYYNQVVKDPIESPHSTSIPSSQDARDRIQQHISDQNWFGSQCTRSAVIGNPESGWKWNCQMGFIGRQRHRFPKVSSILGYHMMKNLLRTLQFTNTARVWESNRPCRPACISRAGLDESKFHFFGWKPDLRLEVNRRHISVATQTTDL